MSSTPVAIGLDIGTSKAKALASTADGKIVAEGAQAYELVTPQPGYVEQDANDVYRAAMRALQSVVTEVQLRAHPVIAIGVSSAMHGLVPVDAQGEPIGPFLTWMDTRSSAIADELRRDGTARSLYRRTGAPMHPMLPLCKLRWMCEHQSDVFKRADRFVSLKELLTYRWCGEWQIDYGIAGATGMFDVYDRRWNASALEVAGVGAQRLSDPVSPLSALPQRASGIGAGLHLEQSVPLVLASSDGALANVGVGALDRGEIALTLGTSGACRTVVTAPQLDEEGRLFCYPLDDRSFILGGPTSSAGAILNWVLDLALPEVPHDQRFMRAMDLIANVPIGSGGVTCLPFLSGERAPYWDANLRGAFLGLDLAHDRAALIRSAVEAIVFTIYAVVRILEKLTGASRSLILSGGLTHAPHFRRMIADIFERRAMVPEQDEASAFGAALMALVAVEALPDLHAAKEQVRYTQAEEPDLERSAAYREPFARYVHAVKAVQPLFHERSRATTGVRFGNDR